MVPPVIALAPELKSSGSVKSWMPPMVEISVTKMIVGRSMGTVMLQNCRHVEAPSMAAAS